MNESGFLDRPKHQTLQPNRKMIYALGQRGAQLLAGGTGACVLQRRDWAERNRQLRLGFLEHALMISRIRSVLTLAVRTRDDVRVESWRQDDEIRDHVKTEDRDGIQRISEKAAPKTINLEIGTVRAILRRHRLWANLQPDVRMLAARDDVGKALTIEDEKKLLNGCAEIRRDTASAAVAGSSALTLQ
jgi:hypothetical protein